MRYVIGLSFAVLTLWVLQATGVLTALLIFLMIGNIPGTQIVVPPSQMLTILLLIGSGLVYWALRHARHIHPTVKPAPTHSQAEPTHAPPAKKRFIAIYHQNYNRTRTATVQVVRRTDAALLRAAHRCKRTFWRAVRPLGILATISIVATAFAAREIAQWSQPYLKRAGVWTWRQVRYSVKGTMLSAHRWSSLSKKVWLSVAVLLSRCNSALKRGKSRLTRAPR